jgi:hypothetical protein
VRVLSNNGILKAQYERLTSNSHLLPGGGVAEGGAGGVGGGGVGATDMDVSCSSLDQKSASSGASILTRSFSAAEPTIRRSKANASVVAFILIMISTCRKVELVLSAGFCGKSFGLA